ncbi:MAG: Mercuric resistance operon regulatory protein [candidate division TA06 bacterium 32_111]|uniref:HTH merR-type domain-containing protein n=1 Tax=candidate division WOR-3 bacterium TaxID=2052148 RepID=A0A348MJZ1_UNCW3|nr:MAG: Mercuric resistance operon regulatory protein [candidate division TA06 bacterium 32_111]HAF07367.1 hypothetical protein [candidate division WOR-3 bacterium]HCP17020.1 hypothetical protein [candidate division WOR-3 bacterium]
MLVETKTTEDFLLKLVQKKIIFPAQKEPELFFFSKDIQKVKKIVELKQLGFTDYEITKISREVGFPHEKDDGGVKLYSIGEFCKKYNLSSRRIKYWEEIGLFFPAVRSKGGVRLYKDSLIIHINFIKNLQKLGFELCEIKSIIESSDTQKIENRIKEIHDTINEIKPIIKNIKKLK